MNIGTAAAAGDHDDMMESFDADQREIIWNDLIDQVRRALRLMNADVSAEYAEAVATVPTLVSRESRIVDFLRTEDYHALRAARRLALFWKTRKDFFGEDRWLLPMTQTGAGALTADQVELLRTGFQAQTTSPQAVTLADRSRLPAGCVDRYHPAIIFYLLTVSTCEEMQRRGTTIFHVINAGHGPMVTPPAAILQKLATSLPYRVRNIVIARTFRPGDDDHLLDYLAHQQQDQVQRNYGRADYVIGDSLRGTLRLLEDRGLDRSGIPLALGGDYFYSQQFAEWVRQRLSTENAMVAAPPVRNTATANAAAASSSSSRSGGGDDGSTTVTHEHVSSQQQQHRTKGNDVVVQRLPGESKVDFEKRRTYLYGKRSYERKRRREGDLQEEVTVLQRVNHGLRGEMRRLETCLAQARYVVAQVTTTITTTER